LGRTGRESPPPLAATVTVPPPVLRLSVLIWPSSTHPVEAAGSSGGRWLQWTTECNLEILPIFFFSWKNYHHSFQKSRQMLHISWGATPNRADSKIVSTHALLPSFFSFIAHAGNVWQENTNSRTSAWGQIESIVDAALHDTRSAFVCMCLLCTNPAPFLHDADARI